MSTAASHRRCRRVSKLFAVATLRLLCRRVDLISGRANGATSAVSASDQAAAANIVLDHAGEHAISISVDLRSSVPGDRVRLVFFHSRARVRGVVPKRSYTSVPIGSEHICAVTSVS